MLENHQVESFAPMNCDKSDSGSYIVSQWNMKHGVVYDVVLENNYLGQKLVVVCSPLKKNPYHRPAKLCQFLMNTALKRAQRLRVPGIKHCWPRCFVMCHIWSGIDIFQPFLGLRGCFHFRSCFSQTNNGLFELLFESPKIGPKNQFIIGSSVILSKWPWNRWNLPYVHIWIYMVIFVGHWYL